MSTRNVETRAQKIAFWQKQLSGTPYDGLQIDFKKLMSNKVHPFANQLKNGPLLVEVVAGDYGILPGPRRIYFIPALAQTEAAYEKGKTADGQTIFKIPMSDLTLAWEVRTTDDDPGKVADIENGVPLIEPTSQTKNNEDTTKLEVSEILPEPKAEDVSILDLPLSSLTVRDLLAIVHKQPSFTNNAELKSITNLIRN